MICALHYNNGDIISTNRIELYEDCCKMLLSTRDTARDITYLSHISLNYEEKKTILSHFAYWLMRNGGQNGTVELFKEKIAYVLKSLDNSHRNTSVEEITQYFIERSGLLQVVENSNIDFIHRSFMEYLTASEVVLQEDWGYLLNCVDDESWLETIGLAIGLASNKQANLAIERILQKNGIKYLIIAAICASNRVSLDENLREQINDGLSLIIPPKDTNTCIEIAKIGDIMVQLLMCQNTYSLHEQLMCLYTLLRINTVQSLRVSFTFLV